MITLTEEIHYLAEKYEDLELCLIEVEDWRLYDVAQCNNNDFSDLNSCKLQRIDFYNDYDDY